MGEEERSGSRDGEGHPCYFHIGEIKMFHCVICVEVFGILCGSASWGQEGNRMVQTRSKRLPLLAEQTRVPDESSKHSLELECTTL